MFGSNASPLNVWGVGFGVLGRPGKTGAVADGKEIAVAMGTTVALIGMTGPAVGLTMGCSVGCGVWARAGEAKFTTNASANGHKCVKLQQKPLTKLTKNTKI